jgi:hypothetical protein
MSALSGRGIGIRRFIKIPASELNPCPGGWKRWQFHDINFSLRNSDG